MQSLVPGTQHQKDRYYNVIDIDKQSCHERTIEELLASELKSCQHIRCRKSQDQKKCKSQRCHNERIQEKVPHSCILKCYYKVLIVKLFWKCPWIYIRSNEFCILLQTRHKYPCNRYNDRNSQSDQSYIDKNLVKYMCRNSVFFLMHISTSLLSRILRLLCL